MLIAPTEPDALKRLGKVSLSPERRGVDVCWAAHNRWWGMQRKELKDFLASIEDGRLEKEIAQMKGDGGFDGVVLPIVVIEGKVRWTNEGEMMQRYGRTWDRSGFNGLLLSMAHLGVHVMWTDNLAATVQLVSQYATWTRRSNHTFGQRRASPAPNAWGQTSNRDWALHLMQSFPGIGPGVAGNIIDEFDGVPMKWTCTEAELRKVKGLGKERVKTLMEAFNGNR